MIHLCVLQIFVGTWDIQFESGIIVDNPGLLVTPCVEWIAAEVSFVVFYYAMIIKSSQNINQVPNTYLQFMHLDLL